MYCCLLFWLHAKKIRINFQPILIYIAGGIGYLATYWKNGAPISLTNDIYLSATTNSVYVSGSDVYVAGNFLDTALYWKNGIESHLNYGVTSGLANVIFVSGGDVYSAGAEIINGEYVQLTGRTV